MIGIYKILSPSNCVYIGQSWKIEKRKSFHKNTLSPGCIKLHNSFKKYGFDNHIFEIINILPRDIIQCTLDAYEQLYIDLYRNCGFELLNLLNADSAGRHSKETKDKMKLSAKKGEDNYFSRNIFSGEKNGMFGKISPNKGIAMSDEKLKTMQNARRLIDTSGKNHYRAKKIINTETGKIYYGLREISEELNTTTQDIWRRLNKNKTITIPFKYLE